MRIAMTSDEAMTDFVKNWIYGCKNQYDWIARLAEDFGGYQYIDNLRRMQKAEEYLIEDTGVDFSYKQVVPKWD